MTLSSSASRQPRDPGSERRVSAHSPPRFVRESVINQALSTSPLRLQEHRDTSAHIVVICVNALTRTCLVHCLASSETGLTVEGYGNVEEWGRQGQGASVVLLCVTGARETAIAVEPMVKRALAIAPSSRVVVISDTKSADDVSKAIEQGASGFIAMDSNVDVAIAAIRLVRSGGVFVPSHSVVQSQSPSAPPSDGHRSLRDVVTAKQLEVIALIRRGLPNKLIAAELEMSEFTVKVHVRNIMKRLQARNRTEVVALTNSFFALQPAASDLSPDT